MKNLFSISKQFIFLLLISFLFLVSCKKEGDFQEKMNAEAETQVELPPLAVEKLIVENVFRIPVEKLSDEQILAHYEEYMQSLSDEDRLTLTANVEKALSAGYNSGAMGSLKNGSTETVLSPEDADLNYGWAVATVGNKVYVGSRDSQKVYEYAKTGGNYNLISEIVPGEEAFDFGTYVSVSGSWMAVAAPEYFPVSGPGKVFMFKKQGNAWVKQAVLTSSSARSFGGNGVVLKGNTLAVGSAALGGVNDPEGSPISVFKLNGNNWTLSETIRQPGNAFFEIDMDNEGNRIVGTGALNGSAAFLWASIFVREGSNWVLEDQVVLPFGTGFLSRDVAIFNNTVVITAVVPGSTSYVFSNNAGDWEFTQELTHPGIPPQNRFVDMSEQKIVIGAASSINFISDAVYVFEKSGGEWSLSETLTVSDNGADKRIWSVAISGNTIVAGLPGSGETPAPGTTSVFD